MKLGYEEGMRILLLLTFAALGLGCAHKPLAGAELDRVARPAFISRIVEGAGPRSEVFRGDSTYAPRLKRLEPREADRRLTVKLQKAMSRFEIAERLRARTYSSLPAERPWTQSLDPARVAQVLQSFLVEEVPANAPDYQLVRELGADAVVEFVIEEYGIKSEDGVAGAYLLGYGRLFTLDGNELWRRNFRVDQIVSNVHALDPFKVAKEPQLWRDTMTQMLDAVAAKFAEDLNPPDRAGGKVTPGSGELEEGADTVPPAQESTDEQPAPEDDLL